MFLGAAVGFVTRLGNHSFRAMGITAFPKSESTPEGGQQENLGLSTARITVP
jgi:hypothetical protein